MQKDEPPVDKPWNDDSQIPDVTQPGWMDPKPGEDPTPPDTSDPGKPN